MAVRLARLALHQGFFLSPVVALNKGGFHMDDKTFEDLQEVIGLDFEYEIIDLQNKISEAIEKAFPESLEIRQQSIDTALNMILFGLGRYCRSITHEFNWIGYYYKRKYFMHLFKKGFGKLRGK